MKRYVYYILNQALYRVEVEDKLPKPYVYNTYSNTWLPSRTFKDELALVENGAKLINSDLFK